METKEIAMSKHTKILGTACVLAMTAVVASPAAAATLTGFAGTLNTSYSGDSNSTPGTDTVHSWLLGGSVAGPLSDLANLNFQVGASYTHNWADHFSREDWNFGGDAFWADNDGRVGIDVGYSNFNRFGHITNGGAIAEWYFGVLTGMAKGGWLSSGGSGIGGHGNYLGAGVAGYFMPDLAITGGVEWTDLVSGLGCGTCGRGDIRATNWQAMAEFLWSEDLGLSVYGAYTYADNKFFNFDSHDNVWTIGLRWYMGTGSLIDHHRNGTLNPWLAGIRASGLTF
jgi:hypothetical protein